MNDDKEVFLLRLIAIPLVIMAIALTYVFLFHERKGQEAHHNVPKASITATPRGSL